MKLTGTNQSLWYLALSVLATLVAVPCVRILPAVIEQYRLSLAGTPLLLTIDMLAAKHLAISCGVVPLVLIVLFFLSLRYEAIANEKTVLKCAVGLAGFYGLLAVLLVISFERASLTQSVLLNEARQAGQQVTSPEE